MVALVLSCDLGHDGPTRSKARVGTEPVPGSWREPGLPRDRPTAGPPDLLDPLLDHPDDPTGAFWIRLDRQVSTRIEAELAERKPTSRRVAVAFDELVLAI
jgi:hypothetical protein